MSATRIEWHRGSPHVVQQGERLHPFDTVRLRGRAGYLSEFPEDARRAADILHAHGLCAPWDGRGPPEKKR